MRFDNTKPMPELSIIIVNWNGIGFLPNCLRSITQNPPSLPYEVIVVDNASSDGSVEWMNSDEAKRIIGDSQFRLIEVKENLGFGRANNLVIDETVSPFAFLLNPDTLVTSGSIDRLLETLHLDDRIGITAPKLLNQDGSVQPSVWGFPPTPLVFLVSGFRLDRLLPRRLLKRWLYGSYWDYSESASVPVFSGAAMMARREMIERVGGFDPAFQMYGEDTEWCVRARRAGWELFYDSDASIYHLGGQSALQRWSPEQMRLEEERASISFQRKCLPRYLVFLNTFTKSFIFGVYLLYNYVKGKEISQLRDLFYLYFGACKLVLLRSDK